MRINLFAGPGAGKSTLASWLFAELKLQGYSIELVSEYVKSWAIAKRQIHPFDQVFLMGKQLQLEYQFITNGVQHIVTDSPVFLAPIYARIYNPDLLDVSNQMESIVCEYERRHPAINIFLQRGDYFQQEGRFHNRKQAEGIDDKIMSRLIENDIKFKNFSSNARSEILRYIKERLK